MNKNKGYKFVLIYNEITKTWWLTGYSRINSQWDMDGARLEFPSLERALDSIGLISEDNG